MILQSHGILLQSHEIQLPSHGIHFQDLILNTIEYVSRTSDFGFDQDCTILDTMNLNLEFDFPKTSILLNKIWSLPQWMQYGKF